MTDLNDFFTLSDYDKELYAKAKTVVAEMDTEIEEAKKAQTKEDVMTKEAARAAVNHVAKEAARAARKIRDDAFLEADKLVCINKDGQVNIEACEKRDAILAAALAAEKIAEATADSAKKFILGL